MKTKSIKSNYVMNSILTMSSFIFPLISFPYISRILLPIGTGKVSFATSLISYFLMFSQLGIPTYGIRACAKIRDNREELTRTVHELFFINLIMSGISYIVLFLTLAFVSKLWVDRTLYIIISFTIILSAIGMEWLYKALEQYTYITIRSIIFKIIALIAMFLLVHTQNDYVLYGGITIFAASASNIFNFINVHKYIDFKPIGGYHLKRHFKAIMIFFSMACATTIYTHIDTVMLGFMKTNEEVGYYNAAVKIKNILVSVVTSSGAVLLPRASYYIETGLLNEFRRISRKMLNFVFLVSLPLMLYFFLFAQQGVYFLSGKAYAGSILPMQIIMPTLPLIGLTNVLGIQILVPLGKENTVLYSEIAGAITNLILNYILIPRFASSGAAIGTLVAEFVVFLVQFFALKAEAINAFRQIHYAKILVALFLSYMFSNWVIAFNFGTLFTLFIGAFLFFTMYGLSLLIMKEPLVVDIAKQFLDKLHTFF